MADVSSETKTKRNLSEGFWRFIIICFILYAFFIVGKVVYDNYQENKGLAVKEEEIDSLKDEISQLQYNIAYYKTNTYKEKVARAKLRYVLPGETVIAVPYDPIEKPQEEEKEQSSGIKKKNYQYWIMYFTQ